ncbi:hypothetical protein CEXT_283851 [Caerostris extrusa]|uniref:Uncharacterized protein n=1 Tax=Caerostris extrusa TaxID=172846 RepID=A0AAV4NME9_CAEEX|nr:hypothetical protein CEXT_283851 [Caerostris extrusa]
MLDLGVYPKMDSYSVNISVYHGIGMLKNNGLLEKRRGNEIPRCIPFEIESCFSTFQSPTQSPSQKVANSRMAFTHTNATHDFRRAYSRKTRPPRTEAPDTHLRDWHPKSLLIYSFHVTCHLYLSPSSTTI